MTTPQSPTTIEMLQLYATEKVELWRNFPIAEVAEACQVVWEAYQGKNNIYACGNGGTLAVAANMINDFNTVPFMPDTKDVVLEGAHRLHAINLGESPAAITATVNDLGPEHLFAEELKVRGISAGDVLFALSGSGNSANIVAAIDIAHQRGAKVVGITRGPDSKVIQLSDVSILISGTSNFPGQTGGNNFNFHFEDATSAIGHMITGFLKEGVKAQANVSTPV